jgi:hypothetical protein
MMTAWLEHAGLKWNSRLAPNYAWSMIIAEK